MLILTNTRTRLLAVMVTDLGYQRLKVAMQFGILFFGVDKRMSRRSRQGTFEAEKHFCSAGRPPVEMRIDSAEKARNLDSLAMIGHADNKKNQPENRRDQSDPPGGQLLAKYRLFRW